MLLHLKVALTAADNTEANLVVQSPIDHTPGLVTVFTSGESVYKESRTGRELCDFVLCAPCLCPEPYPSNLFRGALRE